MRTLLASRGGRRGTKKGRSKILTLLRITRDDTYDRTYTGSSTEWAKWTNDRGIGERNRTKGIRIPDRAVLEVNRVLRNFRFDISYKQEYYKCIKSIKHPIDHIGAGEWYTEEHVHETTPYKVTEEHETEWYTDLDGIPDLERKRNRYKTARECVLAGSNDKRKDVYDPESASLTEVSSDIYVSRAMSQWDYAKQTAYVNFLIEPEEYIPLTFLCSEWIDYVISTGQVSGFRLPGVGTADYAVALEYLNVIKSYLTKREKEEKELITQVLERRHVTDVTALDPILSGTEWTRHLSEWKIENDIHKLHKKNVGKFVNYLLAAAGVK